MYVKLLSPRTKMCSVFECSDEMTFEPRGEMTEADVDKRKAFLEGIGDDPRSFIVWPDDGRTAITEVTIPGPKGSRNGATVLLTNWDAWVCNGNGRSIDRVHRRPVDSVPAAL